MVCFLSVFLLEIMQADHRDESKGGIVERSWKNRLECANSFRHNLGVVRQCDRGWYTGLELE